MQSDYVLKAGYGTYVHAWPKQSHARFLGKQAFPYAINV